MPPPGPRPLCVSCGLEWAVGWPSAGRGSVYWVVVTVGTLLQRRPLSGCGKALGLGPELPRCDCPLPPLSRGTFTWLHCCEPQFCPCAAGVPSARTCMCARSASGWSCSAQCTSGAPHGHLLLRNRDTRWGAVGWGPHVGRGAVQPARGPTWCLQGCEVQVSGRQLGDSELSSCPWRTGSPLGLATAPSCRTRSFPRLDRRQSHGRVTFPRPAFWNLFPPYRAPGGAGLQRAVLGSRIPEVLAPHCSFQHIPALGPGDQQGRAWPEVV